MISLFGNC